MKWFRRLDDWSHRVEEVLDAADQPDPPDSPGGHDPVRPGKPGQRSQSDRLDATRCADRWRPRDYVDPDLARLRKERWRAEVDRQFRLCVRLGLTISSLVVGSSTSLDVLIVISLVAVAFLARYPEFI